MNRHKLYQVSVTKDFIEWLNILVEADSKEEAFDRVSEQYNDYFVYSEVERIYE